VKKKSILGEAFAGIRRVDQWGRGKGGGLREEGALMYRLSLRNKDSAAEKQIAISKGQTKGEKGRGVDGRRKGLSFVLEFSY